jgi:hypothetical protein
MKRVSIIGIIALIVYASPWTETDVLSEGAGEGRELQAWIALGTGVLSLAASTIGLLMKLMELRERRRAKN